jgi:hypothetical protein
LLQFGWALAPARVGAADDTFKQSAELAKRMSKTSEDVDKYVTQLDKTEQALSSVSQAQGKDLKKRYESFSKEVENLEDAQKHATTDIDEMKSTGAEYFAAWDTSIAQMSNPELKQASTERRSKVMKDHDDLTATLKSFMETDLSSENVGKAEEMTNCSRSSRGEPDRERYSRTSRFGSKRKRATCGLNPASASAKHSEGVERRVLTR